MPKETVQKPADEVEKDEATGLMVMGDPFGGDLKSLVGIADPSEWEVLEEDYGLEIDWSVTPRVAGQLVAFKEVEIDHDDERGMVPTSLYGIINAVTRQRECFWGNFQIDKTLEKRKYIGRLILLEHKGKRDVGKGGRTVNTFNILVKREPVNIEVKQEEEPF